MGPESEASLDQIFGRRPSDSEVAVRATGGVGRVSSFFDFCGF
jgi:hypothetical protein